MKHEIENSTQKVEVDLLRHSKKKKEYWKCLKKYSTCIKSFAIRNRLHGIFQKMWE